MTKQTQQQESPDPKTNRILKELNAEDRNALVARGKVVQLKFGKCLYRQDEPIGAVYFPLSCMVSLLVSLNGKMQMEMATVGREGVVGAAEVLQNQGGMGLSIIQIAGAALRIPADSFLKELTARPLLERLMHRHFYALARQILHGAACNRVHSMEERCARWLLMTHERASDNSFPLTQEFLSHMLGVRRATVNVATGMLKKAGFIRYVRGQITVIDRAGLESASCECYKAIIQAYDSVMNKKPDR
ncbi:MAG TPA: Crp/Fnr family transcriptional regulator [Bryobacteraceae bacterium]|nr:Crp/Fnr family transcriptional regulator [Bryobacteraceae bacterium]